MLHEFEEGYENIRIWLDAAETNLQRPFSTANSMESDIEKHTPTVTALLALGHNLLTETEIRPRNIDTVARAVQTLEERWVALKERSRKRKLEFVLGSFSFCFSIAFVFSINDIQTSWRSVEEMYKQASKMITDHERFLVEVKRANSADGFQGIRNECKSLENFKRTLENDEKIIQQISHSYSEVLRSYPTADTHGEMKGRMAELTHRWDALNATFHESWKNVKRKNSEREKFVCLFS